MIDALINASLLLIAALVAGVAAVSFLAGRRGRADTAREMARIIETSNRLAEKQAEMSGQLQQSQATVGERLEALSKRLGDGLAQQTEKTGLSLKGLHERLAVIDSAQKNITELSSQLVGLQDILSNKQARGAFGQVRLEDLVSDALPPNAYAFEHTLSNGTRVDCLVKLPSPPGGIAIDSKFPLEAYRALRASSNDAERVQAERAFKRDFAIHVKAISDKYLIPGETADWAVMFLPSEAIYAEAHANFPALIDDAHRRRVAIVSPTTLMATLNTVRAILKDAEMQEQAGLIQQEVERMLNDVRLLDERVGKLRTHFRQAGEDIDGIAVSTRKITDRGDKIKNVQLDEADDIPPLPHLKEVE
jgi:DNA recombination protein RmuC